jgi:hypothetical protein
MYASCLTRYVGSMSSVTRTTMPNAPSPTGSPAKSGADRSALLTSPSAATYSRPASAADRIWLPLPEPWVPVAVAPAMEMCGSEPRLCSAQPRSWSHAASAP